VGKARDRFQGSGGTAVVPMSETGDRHEVQVRTPTRELTTQGLDRQIRSWKR
jgi:hypothetical protein